MTTPNVRYIARLTCACGATVETEARATLDSGFGYGCSCKAELTHDNPDDWFGGYDGKPVQCGPCLRREIDERMAKETRP